MMWTWKRDAFIPSSPLFSLLETCIFPDWMNTRDITGLLYTQVWGMFLYPGSKD